MLTDKQGRFVAEYLVDLNATQAAVRSGYSARTAMQQGSRLLMNVEIAAAVQTLKAQQLAKADLTAMRVLEEYRRLAFFDTRSLFDADGSLKPVNEWTPEQGSAVASLEVIVKNAAAGDGHLDTVHKLKVWDKTRALESLAKHFGLLAERVEHSGGLTLVYQWED